MQSNNELRHEIKITKSNLNELLEVNSSLKLEINQSKVLIDRLLLIENSKFSFHLLTSKVYIYILLGSGSYMAEQSLDLVNHVEELLRVNKELKDRNEELEINMLSFPFVDDWLVEQLILILKAIYYFSVLLIHLNLGKQNTS